MLTAVSKLSRVSFRELTRATKSKRYVTSAKLHQNKPAAGVKGREAAAFQLATQNTAFLFRSHHGPAFFGSPGILAKIGYHAL